MGANGLVNLALSRAAAALFTPTVTLWQQFSGTPGKPLCTLGFSAGPVPPPPLRRACASLPDRRPLPRTRADGLAPEPAFAPDHEQAARRHDGRADEDVDGRDFPAKRIAEKERPHHRPI